MSELHYDGKTIKGKSSEHIACKLRKKPYYLTYREIAELLEVNRQTVANWMKRHNLDCRIKKPKAEPKKKSGLTSMDKRRRFLARYLFGNDYRPGPNFIKYLHNRIGKPNASSAPLTTIQQSAIRNFYLIGTQNARSKNRYSRVLLSRSRQSLKGIITKEVDYYLEKGVIKSG